ncbi:hypothetical protein NSK_002319 [Nannochloropsis salina CCMP1776]|uniref:Uncharacterized protein n=1 Tax=Nannochloropsis salina CCMP1776 TaxID=1027361 RepID=A0A4D9DB49_9STRA|nr:hypothetical protein NSK_002319 [Nannochloropsis salina CCMP1776]|eukprot:TFJ86665.1 hypothetical protein NSK_002319 [Nannochloropsis salina CCMP1776]
MASPHTPATTPLLDADPSVRHRRLLSVRKRRGGKGRKEGGKEGGGGRRKEGRRCAKCCEDRSSFSFGTPDEAHPVRESAGGSSPGKSTLNIYRLDLTGSRIADIANGTFKVKARNVVSFRNTDMPRTKALMSTVSVQVQAQVPRGNVIPHHVLESGGSLVIQGILKVMVPRFVKILAKDYEVWSSGDDSRAAVAQDLEEKLTTPKL